MTYWVGDFRWGSVASDGLGLTDVEWGIDTDARPE